MSEAASSIAKEGAADEDIDKPASTVVPETNGKDETGELAPRETGQTKEEGLGTQGMAQKVKFEADQEKGNARDEGKAEESVLD